MAAASRALPKRPSSALAVPLPLALLMAPATALLPPARAAALGAAWARASRPAQAASPVPEVFSRIVALQRGAPILDRGVYEQFRRRGVAAMRIADGTTQIQSGITSSLIPGRTTISRIRMFGFIARSLSLIGDPFVKLPITEEWEAGLLGEVGDFLGRLLGEGKPGQQRIAAYAIQPISGDDDKGRGIYRVRTQVRTLESALQVV